MNGKGNVRKWAALLLVAALALVAAAPAAPAQAGNPNPGVLPPQAHPHGHTYGEWEVRYWQWAAAIPWHDAQGHVINPLVDATGALCGQGQSGAVWYLASNAGGSTIRNDCVIPPGKSLLISPVGGECSMVEPDPFHGDNEAELRACAKQIMDGATDVSISVDGVPLNLADYRFSSPLYTITFAEDNPFGNTPGPTLSVADGYVVMLNPLPPGRHTIYMHGAIPALGFTTEVTYHLTVGH